MNLPDFTGADAPTTAFDGDVLTLRYDSLATYEARVHADFATLAAAPGVRVVESWMPHVAAHLGHVLVVVRVADAPLAAPPTQPSRKSR
jgi:hypothetical protein